MSCRRSSLVHYYRARAKCAIQYFHQRLGLRWGNMPPKYYQICRYGKVVSSWDKDRTRDKISSQPILLAGKKNVKWYQDKSKSFAIGFLKSIASMQSRSKNLAPAPVKNIWGFSLLWASRGGQVAKDTVSVPAVPVGMPHSGSGQSLSYSPLHWSDSHRNIVVTSASYLLNILLTN